LRITKRNILFHEIIGLGVRVLRHSDPTLEGLEGRVVWETTNAIYVLPKDGGRPKLILKRGGLFAFMLPQGDVAPVKGEQLIGDPVDRAKRMRYRGALDARA